MRNELANSDRSGLLLSYSIFQHACSSSVSRLVWDYKKANSSKACVMLGCFDWDSVFEQHRFGQKESRDAFQVAKAWQRCVLAVTDQGSKWNRRDWISKDTSITTW